MPEEKKPVRLTPDRDPITGLVYNMNTGTKFEFPAMPDEISDNENAQFEDQAIAGRSAPIFNYSSSGPRSVSFSITLHDDYCKDGILATVNKFKALVYPSYRELIASPKCYIRIGDFIRCICVVESVDVTWKKPYRNGIYIVADVNISLKEVADVPYSTHEIEGGIRK
ncbi:hypothetical protein HSE3_gp077 [Bacillus phage vB_BceM-HSE3]|nr:hypothetical protein HSE3_gp077 [Bacillus phage vB_BceM-HSE3]